MRSSSSLPFFPKLCKAVLGFRQANQNTTGSVVEKRCPDRPFPPARRPGRALIVADDDQIRAYLLGAAADFLHWLAHGEVTRSLEPLVRQGLYALVEHRLGAFFLFFQQLFGDETLGEEEARRHAGHGQQVRFGAEKARQVSGFEQGAPAFLRAVVCEKNLSILHARLLR